MAVSDSEARRERLKKARESLGTPAKPKGLRHPDVEGEDPLGDGTMAGAGGLRGMGQAGGLRGRPGEGGLRGGGLRGGLRGGGLGGGLGRGEGAEGGGDPAAQRAFLQERLAKLQARLAELDTGVEDAMIVDEEPGPARKG